MTYTLDGVLTTEYSVSSPKKLDANCYTNRPSAVQNISYVPTSGQIVVSWDAPSNLADASGNNAVVGNGSIQYYVKLYQEDENSSYSLFVDYTAIISSRNATFDGLANSTNYKIEVYAGYSVANTGNNTYTRSAVAELYPVQSAVAPIGINSFTAVPTNTGSAGKQVELSFTLNSADSVVFGTTDFTFSIERKIYDCSSNALLSTSSYDLTSSNLTGYNSGNSGET